jgi:UDP-4-amino-4,6-dideoxy-N-acetyl-beta-L-altrosamine transaminase
MKSIPYGKQSISQEDIDAIVETLKSDFLTQGPAVETFEETIKTYTSAKYCIAVNSATSALHIACLAAGLGEGDLLWTSPISFVASSNCALYCGAKVDFVDIDSQTYNMSPSQLEDKLKKSKQLPKIVIPVHLSGLSCDMEAFRFLSSKYGFTLIEDSSHAIGGDYKNAKVGSCEYSDASIFSFHPVKIITTGEGGVITTNNFELYQKMTRLRTHGITRDPKLMSQYEGPWYYEQLDLGFNYRITDLQCALGTSQMKRLELFIQKRRAIAALYDTRLKHLPITTPFQPDYQKSSYHLYIIKTKHRLELFNHLRSRGVGVNVHYIPIHMQPYYQKLGFKKRDFPLAEQYYKEALSLPIFPDLTQNDLESIIEYLEEFFTGSEQKAKQGDLSLAE